MLSPQKQSVRKDGYSTQWQDPAYLRGAETYILLPVEAYLPHIHVRCFLQVRPRCIYHVNVVHLAACQERLSSTCRQTTLSKVFPYPP